MAVLLPHTFVFSCLLRGFCVTVQVLRIRYALEEKGLVLK